MTLLAVVAVTVALLLWIAVRLTDDRSPAASPSRTEVERTVVGRGARAAAVVRPAGADSERVVVFLHGWGLLGPRAYRAWIERLAREGATVILPRYQSDVRTPAAGVLDNAVAGVRSALERTGGRPDAVTVVGHSGGAALAADYAAVAAARGLPAARAVLAIYPGRAIRDDPSGIPAQDLSRIPRSTRLVVMASADDHVVGDGPARELIEAAGGLPRERRRLVEVSRPAVTDHFAPVLDGPEVRRTFWAELDRLMGRAG